MPSAWHPLPLLCQFICFPPVRQDNSSGGDSEGGTASVGQEILSAGGRRWGYGLHAALGFPVWHSLTVKVLCPINRFGLACYGSGNLLGVHLSVWTCLYSAQRVGAAQWHKAGRLTAACRPDAFTRGGCEAGRWCRGADHLPDRLWPSDGQTDEQTAVLSSPIVSRVTGGLCVRPGPCHRGSFLCPPSRPFTHPPKHTCTPARTHTQFHCNLSPDWIKPNEQRAKLRDCFHTDRRQGLCALRNQPSVCPCSPHLIQSKHNERSSVSSPNSLLSHPLSFLPHGFFPTLPHVLQNARKCNSLFSPLE